MNNEINLILFLIDLINKFLIDFSISKYQFNKKKSDIKMFKVSIFFYNI
jgi:hypothetical protein